MPFKNIKFRIPMNLQHFAEGDPPAGGDPNGGQDPKGDQEPEMFSKEYVEKLRKENAKYRTKANDLETTSQQQQEEAKRKQQEILKQMSEALGFDYNPDVELQKQLDEAKREALEAKQNAHNLLIQANMEKVGANFTVGEGEEAVAYTLVDPELAFMVINKDNLQLGEKGKVEGMQEEMKNLFDAKPHLFAPVGSGNQQQQAPPKPNSFKPGPPNKSNNPKPADAYSEAREKLRSKLKK